MKRIHGTSYQSGRLKRHFLPIVIWLGALAGIFFMFQQRSQSFEVVGFAQGQMRQIAAIRTGRLKGIHVELFQEVKKGDILAELNDEELLAELETAQGEIEHLKVELAVTADKLRTDAAERNSDRMVDERRFSTGVEEARLRVLELKTTLVADKIMLKDADLRLANIQKLVEENNLSAYNLQQPKLERDLLREKIDNAEETLRQAEQYLNLAQEQRQKFLQLNVVYPSLEKNLAMIDNAIKVQEKIIDQLQVRRRSLILKSPLEGVVSQILSRPGETVTEGVPFLTIAETKSREIIAYASEVQANRMEVGMEVEIVKNSQPPQVAKSQIIRIGPIVETKPLEMWRNPNIPERGRPCMIAVRPGMNLVPGEKIQVRGL